MEREAPGDERAAGPSPEEILASLFGTSVEEMRERPEVAREKLASVFRELSRLKKAEGGHHALDSTREVMRRIRREFEARGESVPAGLEELPERLAALAERLDQSTPGEWAELLRGLAGSIEAPDDKDDGGANLDEVAAWFESNFGSLVGSERARQREDARAQARYREAAKRSIAASLRKHGIQPLSTDPAPAPPRPRMKRHHLFWKEFEASAADLRSRVLGGEADKAQRRITEMLDAFDLELSITLTPEGEDAVLAFMPTDDLAKAVELQLVVRDSPRLPGWRFVRGRRYEKTAADERR